MQSIRLSQSTMIVGERDAFALAMSRRIVRDETNPDAYRARIGEDERSIAQALAAIGPNFGANVPTVSSALPLAIF